MLIDEDGNVTFTYGILSDVTDLYRYVDEFSYSFSGPNEEALFSKMIRISSNKKLLTKRQISILILVKEGLSSSQIADRLCISLETVNTHRKNIIRKLGASNSFDALKRAQKLGLF